MKGDWVLVACGALAVFGVGLAFCGCKPAAGPEPSDRARVRSVILTLAASVDTIDEACAVVAVGKADLSLADACASAYDVARTSLVAAEGALDASADAGACAALPALRALRTMADSVRGAGGALPVAVVDALEVATTLARFSKCEAQ